MGSWAVLSQPHLSHWALMSRVLLSTLDFCPLPSPSESHHNSGEEIKGQTQETGKYSLCLLGEGWVHPAVGILNV